MPAAMKDMRFLIHDVFNFSAHYASLKPTQAINRQLIDTILDEAARFTDAEIAPLNSTGDEEGCRWQAGAVTTPTGFKAAYHKYIAAGWAA